MNELYGITTENNLGAGILIKIMFSITSALFDYNPKLNDAMKVTNVSFSPFIHFIF